MKYGLTAKDVARLAGVSQSSVSRVYFEGASVSKKTGAVLYLASDLANFVARETIKVDGGWNTI